MTEKPWAEKSEEERYGHPVGGFNWQIERLDLGEPLMSQIARNLCRGQHVWPEQMLGATHPGVATMRGIVPLATGRSGGGMVGVRFAFVRRLLWRATYERTELAVETIAEITGYAVGTVRPWARDEEWRRFEAREGETWWWYHGPSLIDLVGCEMPEYLKR